MAPAYTRICSTPTMGACNVMKKIEMISSAATSAIAQCTTLRSKTTSSEKITSRPASAKNSKVEACMAFRFYCTARMTSAVTTTLSSASGSIIFQPSRMT